MILWGEGQLRKITGGTTDESALAGRWIAGRPLQSLGGTLRVLSDAHEVRAAFSRERMLRISRDVVRDMDETLDV